jgi:hypothetical protein
MPEQKNSPKSRINIKQLLAATNKRRSSERKKPLKLSSDGKTVVLSNGAHATWKAATSPKSGKQYAKWTIVKGTDKKYMKKISQRRGKGSAKASPSSPRKSK